MKTLIAQRIDIEKVDGGYVISTLNGPIKVVLDLSAALKFIEEYFKDSK